ncbi:MAG: PHP domain-containing protein [Anaerolineae bacterium]|nr:PHP domain-containing protein [Anaerolineae bacterium]MDW8072094.1 PHP domain-containing protein [Anaerolineae bacterium]
MRIYIAELHVHTVLSPCAEVEMIPPLIVRTALERGINLLAITDHNASANVEAVMRAAQGSALTVLPGMEVQTREEVHMLCLFDTLEQLADWQRQVDAHLPDLENNAELFGEQFVVDETGAFIRRERRLLLASTQMGLEEAATRVHALGGLAVPAHIDRKAFSLITNLGFVPTGVPFAALEITRHLSPTQARQRFPQIGDLPLMQSGDAHRLDEIVGSMVLTMEVPTMAELRLALGNCAGRSAVLQQRVDRSEARADSSALAPSAYGPQSL